LKSGNALKTLRFSSTYTQPQAPEPIRIMPLGDSITYGSGAAGGYRLPLYAALTNAGYNVDFVGTQTGNGATGLPDSDHEGHSGWVISQLDANIIDWLYTIDDPDVVLLHIGTNDSGASDFSNRVDRLDDLVTKIATNRPNANIIVTTLMKRSDLTRYAAITNYFNPFVEGKVLAQQALGRKVQYLDMHAYLELTDLVDGLHPNSTGYVKMASAWLPVITNAVSVYGDASAPALARAVNLPNLQGVKAVFSKAMDPDTATNIANYALSGGATISGATLSADGRTVTLATSALTRDAVYTLTVNNVKDYSWPVQQTIAADSTDAFRATVRGYLANVPESAGYRLAYALDIPTKGNFNGTPDFYRYDQSSATGAFDRIAYYMELVKADATTQYVWTAMDAFTAYRKQTGVPTVASKEVFQQYVTNLDVKSNVSGVTAGTSLSNGNIEFWPGSYSIANALGIVNASASYFDWGDTRTSSGAGYGSMQVHNAGLSQVLFALNDFGTDNAILDVGIGNQSTTAKDWTQTYNAGSYASRKLYVMVRPSAPAQASDLPAEIAANVSSDLTRGYQLVCSITNVPVLGKFNDTSWASTNYVVDRRSLLCSNSFRRIAYYLELQTATDAVPRYVWTSMDAFTPDPAQIGIPLAGTLFQQKVSNLDVACNVSSVATGTGIATGNIEFWPSNYGTGNDKSIPGASGGTFDFGDGGATSGTGHGCMQVHNYGANQTIWAINHFNSNNPIGTGIGNGPGSSGDPDYTFTYNAGTYTRSIFHVLVLPGGEADTTAPTLSSAVASRARCHVFAAFSEALSDNAARDGTFTLNNGATVTGATLATNKTGIVLSTSLLTAGQTYTLTVSGVRDRSANVNLIADNSTVSFTAPSTDLPAVLANVPETGDYTLIHQLAISNNVYWVNGCDYSVDESRFPQSEPFNRIAYCLDLTGTNGVAKWVYVSMDAFTYDITKIGVPSSDRGEIYQQYVSNLIIHASENVAGASVVTGQVAVGNIEFWPGDYSTGNAFNIPGANASTYDFGDTRSSGGTYGSMQIHNFAAAQTILSMCHFGGSGFRPCLGIGNQPSGNPDWPFNENANTYSVKNLYVLVRRGGTGVIGNGPEIIVQPQSHRICEGLSTHLYVSAADAVAYQWRKNGEWIVGATQPWLAFTPARETDEAVYDVLVYGANDATLSASADLVVYPPGTMFFLR